MSDWSINSEKQFCRFHLSPDCLDVGLKSTFVGRCCYKCFLMKRKIYYNSHREQMITRAKLRQKATYIPRKKKEDVVTTLC